MNNTKIFPGLYQTYQADLDLFSELNLQPFRDAPHAERVEVGIVDMPAGKVKIEVTCVPAKFWRFQIFPSDESDGQRIIIRTGSGLLGDYWPCVVKFLQGMIVIEEAPKEPTDE